MVPGAVRNRRGRFRAMTPPQPSPHRGEGEQPRGRGSALLGWNGSAEHVRLRMPHRHRIDLDAQASSSLLSLEKLKELSLEEDTRVVLVAGGKAKTDFIQLALGERSCNVLVTDSETARELVMRG